MLYPPTDDPAWHYDMNNHELIMSVTVFFCWHVLLIIVGLMCQYLFVRRMYLRASESMRECLDELVYNDRASKTRSNGYNSPGGIAATLALHSDDEEIRRPKHVITEYMDYN